MPNTRPIAQNSPAAQERPYSDVLLNRYRIMGARGTGGFGTVLTCWDTRLQRRVAIKRLPLQGTGAAAASTLSEALSEARTSSMLAHPSIVTVYDFEVEGSFAYLVMEYVDGLTLSELLQRVEGGTLTHDECACLVQSIASALGYAHENGVLHLDIKPTNIMIDRAGAVKLCDFGMATLASAAGFGGARGGTVGYMPPEQIEGDIVDERSDVFSLAVVVWQALFGASPFAAPTAERSLALINKGPGRPSKLDPALAGMAEEALLQALAPDPSARTTSVETLAKQLVYALGDPIAGGESLRGLLSQTQSDTASDADDWEGERLPLAVSYPWLPGAFVRLLSAATTALCTYPVATSLLASRVSGHAPVLATAACAAAAMLWPPLGSALVAAGFCAAVVLKAHGAASLLLVLVIALSGIAWWATCALRDHLATPAILLPACLTSPLVGAPLAGYALPPAQAAGTAMVSWLVGRLWGPAMAANFALDGLVDSLLLPLAAPAPLLSLLGCVAGALICSALTRHDLRVGFAIAGQVLGCVVLVGFQLVAARVENGGIWADPSWSNTGIAVLFTVLACVACVLHGPQDARTGE